MRGPGGKKGKVRADGKDDSVKWMIGRYVVYFRW